MNRNGIHVNFYIDEQTNECINELVKAKYALHKSDALRYCLRRGILDLIATFNLTGNAFPFPTFLPTEQEEDWRMNDEIIECDCCGDEINPYYFAVLRGNVYCYKCCEMHLLDFEEDWRVVEYEICTKLNQETYGRLVRIADYFKLDIEYVIAEAINNAIENSEQYIISKEEMKHSQKKKGGLTREV